MSVEGLPPRIASKIAVTADGCWQWIAYVGPNGYGYVYSDPETRRPVLAHRFVYELLVGPIAHGLQIDHLCRNRACVRPEHLEAVTASVNNLRKPPPPPRPLQVACHRGHAFSPSNTYITPSGKRQCHACAISRQKARRAARRAAATTTTTA